MELVTVENVTFRYAGSEKNALDGVSLNIAEGDFLVLCGRSGCGKTTLLRQLKPQLSPKGEISGKITFLGEPPENLPERESAAEIGFVMQSPEDQVVTDKVWHELAFGLESLGLDNSSVRRRTAETASFFGIQDLFRKNVSELSGGQTQLLNLASVMAMRPRLLILDEPTSQLDPIAASELLSMLKKINTELGTTVILSEHRFEEALPLASRVVVMENGRIICEGSAAAVCAALKEQNSGMFLAMPAAARIWGAVDAALPCPVSVNEGRGFLAEFTAEKPPMSVPERQKRVFGEEMIALRGAWFAYDREQPDVIKNADISARTGELLCVLGGNGTGKTTLLRLLCGIKKPYRGERAAKGRVCMLPQDPRILFSKKTVYEELCESASERRLTDDEARVEIDGVIRRCGLGGLENRHPYDLSGGEQQRAALAKLLLLKPDVLLADEPTKGMDAEFKAAFAAILRGLAARGMCIVTVSHDVEFCAEYADRCALFFDGAVAAEGEPREFFADNSFYTTAARRISNGIIDGAVTVNDVVSALGGKPESAVPFDFAEASAEAAPEPLSERVVPRSLPLWRKIGAAFFAIAAVIVYFIAAKTENFSETLSENVFEGSGLRRLLFYCAVLLCAALAAALSGGGKRTPAVRKPKKRQKLSKRTAAAIISVLALVPLTLFIGARFVPQNRYYITALLILFECMLPFFLAFEGRKPKARELVIMSVLCALAIAGRAAFFMLPQFKPILAAAIIAGAALGGETGFLVGAVSMLVSNIMFSQGPWTPWQMFAAGFVGFLAGILCRLGILRRTRLSLCVFGAVCAVVIYGGIMNPVSAMLAGGEAFSAEMLAACYITGLPMDCVHAASTALFLWFLSEPTIEKIERAE